LLRTKDCCTHSLNRPATMDGRQDYSHCHLKGHLSKLGLANSPRCQSCLQKGELGKHILCDCEATAYLRFRHMGHYFMKPSDCYDAPYEKSYASWVITSWNLATTMRPHKQSPSAYNDAPEVKFYASWVITSWNLGTTMRPHKQSPSTYNDAP
jgi:hypothetical protein